MTLRFTVGICLINKEKKVFMGYKRDYWQMPQGGIEKGELVVDAAYREMHEETGIKKDKLLYLYTDPKEYKCYFPQRVNNMSGQRQKWIFFAFLGQDSDILIDYKEFCNWQWSNFDFVISNAPSFKKDAYSSVINFCRKNIFFR